MAAVLSWEEFVKDNLLQSNLFSGVCLLSKLGEIVYTFGQLQNLSKEEIRPFLQAFQTTSPKAEQQVLQDGFTWTNQENATTHFKIYSKTYHSVYCTSMDNRHGLTVNKLPYGVLLCLYTYPVTAPKAVKQVEIFCDKMQ